MLFGGLCRTRRRIGCGLGRNRNCLELVALRLQLRHCLNDGRIKLVQTSHDLDESLRRLVCKLLELFGYLLDAITSNGREICDSKRRLLHLLTEEFPGVDKRYKRFICILAGDANFLHLGGKIDKIFCSQAGCVTVRCKRLVELVHLLVGFYRLIGKHANAYRNGGKGCDHKSADTQQSLQCGAEGTR